MKRCLDPDAGDAGQGEGLGRAGIAQRGQTSIDFTRAERIGLVQGHDLRLPGNAGAVGRQFTPDRPVGRGSVPGGPGGPVDQMQQHPAAFDMAEKAVADPLALVGAFDQARDIGQNEVAVARVDDAQMRMQGGERIVGDPGPGARNPGEEGRFAGIRQADQPGIGNQLQAQPQRAFLAGPARFAAARRAVGRALEMDVAAPAIAALGEQRPVADRYQIGHQGLPVLLENLGAGRHRDREVGPRRAGARLAHAVMAALGLEMLAVAEIDQGVQAVGAFGVDMAAAAAVAAVRAAVRDVFFAPERDAAAAAGA